MTYRWPRRKEPPLLREGKPVVVYCQKDGRRRLVVVGADGRHRCRGCRRVVRVAL